MRLIAQHIVFFLILFFAFSVEAYSEGISSLNKHSENDCECCALSNIVTLEKTEDECTSCCCVLQQEEDMYLTPVTSIKEVDFSKASIITREENNSNNSLGSLKSRIIPFHITKTSFPFLQVILA